MRSSIVPALFTGLAVALVVRVLIPPTCRLGPRVRPYTIGSRTTLGRSADVRALVSGGSTGGAFLHLFVPIVRGLAERLGRLLDRSSDEGLSLRLGQAGLYPDLAEAERLAAHRVRQLVSVARWGGGGVVAALLLGMGAAQGLAFGSMCVVIGATRQRGKLERAITDRRARMRIEIYTVNQLMAMRVRAGGGVIQAVHSLVARGRGEVIAELREGLRLHRSGMRAAEAFGRLAELTPEPYCARTYSLLAIAEERGVDLAHGLLALSEDVREARREDLRRSATRRRAAMLVPTIAILAPVMLLFVGAPLPSLLLGFR